MEFAVQDALLKLKRMQALGTGLLMHLAAGRTNRSEHLYGDPGTVYVYICYGMHHLFNVITNKKDTPSRRILIRALEPMEGVEDMLKRSGKLTADYTLTKGPGNLHVQWACSKMHSGGNVFSEEIFIEDDGLRYKKDQIVITKRIGVDGAGKDAQSALSVHRKGKPLCECKKILELRTRNCFSSV